MEKVVIDVAKTDSGYGAACDLLPGWIVAVSGDFTALEKEVKESIDFYVECAKEAHEDYPLVLDGAYRIEYRFITQEL